MYEASSSASIRWKFCTMSTKLNRGCTPSSKRDLAQLEVQVHQQRLLAR